jgi:oxysterol-binding protein-related protein 9/10/11
MLCTTSFIEFPMYFAERPSLFVAPAKESDPATRALRVLIWFLSTLRQQHSHRPDRRKGKPFNPFLGELFLGKWEGDEGATEFTAEQVCHHPPTTAYHIRNAQHAVTLQGHYRQRTYFDRTLHIKRDGYAEVVLEQYDEKYLITLPGVHLEGMIPPPPTPEIDSDKPTYIESSSGFTAKITYSGRGWFRGTKNSFSATLYPAGREDEPIYAAEGQWSGTFTIKNAKSGDVMETFDVLNMPITHMSVAPLGEQDPLESRRAWAKVCEAILSGNMSAVGREKGKIEVRQREMRKEEQAAGREYSRRYFEKVPNDSELEARLARLGEKLEPEQTGGVWRWKEGPKEIAQE